MCPFLFAGPNDAGASSMLLHFINNNYYCDMIY